MSSAGAASRRRSTEQAPPRGLGSSGGGLPDENAGWRYTLRVPSWSQAQLPDGDTAVFYQVPRVMGGWLAGVLRAAAPS